MKKNLLPFNYSSPLSIGLELEFQIINPLTYDLIGRAKDLIRSISGSKYNDVIKPEITQSMIEINSSVHRYPRMLHKEIINTSRALTSKGKQFNIIFCGGGTHPFQKWSNRVIFPTLRYKNISRTYGYLAKVFTVFAIHIHVGCANGDDAIYLTHMLSRYVPQLIAISASSPFYQGVDTGYHSTRFGIVNSFPLSGTMPLVTSWKEFSNYYHMMYQLGIIKSVKDFYWDIRPKPEFGTVEIRVCDTPLTIHKAIVLSAYIQALSRYILSEKPFKLEPDLYLIYKYNCFQATRFGYEGNFVNPFDKKCTLIHEDIQNTIETIRSHVSTLGSNGYISQLSKWVSLKLNDAIYLKKAYNQTQSFKKIMKKKCQLWVRSTRL